MTNRTCPLCGGELVASFCTCRRRPIKMTHYMTREGPDEIRVLDMTTGKSEVLKCACGRKAHNLPNSRCKSCDDRYWEGFRAGAKDARDRMREVLGEDAP